MTVSQAISVFLAENERVGIDTIHPLEGADQNGLSKKTERSIRNFINSEYEITESYEFVAKQTVLSASDRKEADEWLEELIYWTDDRSYYGNFPELGNNRKIVNIDLTGAPSSIAEEDNETRYKMSLSITYTRERED